MSGRVFPSAGCLLLAAALAAMAAPASAGGERTYGDSYGNLVIHSPAGFKRILVGKGHHADRLAYHDRPPKRVYLEEEDGALYLRKRRPGCRHGVLLHGRSYMYGLPDHVVPVPTASCR
ncbi:hypothetical protein [Nitratireductor sp. GCM10026969]|uniref:hypothetical protein n=1 Tax=Nitratireductor sp. GCM10026969 TaxID=3252645 RepID=UPI0036138923